MTKRQQNRKKNICNVYVEGLTLLYIKICLNTKKLKKKMGKDH